MKKRQHLKEFQIKHYKTAEWRIRKAVFEAQAIFINCAFPWPPRNLKRYQFI